MEGELLALGLGLFAIISDWFTARVRVIVTTVVAASITCSKSCFASSRISWVADSERERI